MRDVIRYAAARCRAQEKLETWQIYTARALYALGRHEMLTVPYEDVLARLYSLHDTRSAKDIIDGLVEAGAFTVEGGQDEPA